MNKEGVQLAKKFNDWIRVADSLPEDKKNVLVSFIWRGQAGVEVGNYDLVTKRWYLERFMGYVTSDGPIPVEVYAWQPLPKPLRAAGVAEAEATEATK